VATENRQPPRRKTGGEAEGAHGACDL